MKHFIPIVNNVKNLLPKALEGCKNLWDKTIIIDNRDTSEELQLNLREFVDETIQILKPHVPLTTAQSMNLMLEISKNDSFFTWQHLDAICLEDSDIKLHNIAQKLCDDNVNWGILFTNYDSFAAYNVKALIDVNGWDWKRFPYYFLDNDIHYRLYIKNYALLETYLPVYHEISTTIKFDVERNIINKFTFESSEKMYEQKWGTKPNKKLTSNKLKLPEDFNWEFYINYHQDLVEYGMKTETQAIEHYLNHGWVENRIYTLNVNKNFNKIFQIGFNKCGTTSLHKFFLSNGLKSIHWGDALLAKKIKDNCDNNLPPLMGYDNYDCFTDMESSWDDIFIYLTHYKELDKFYPNSKFILNIRNVDKWIESRLNHPEYLPSHMKITGLNKDGVIQHWRKQWFDHIQNVKNYFSDRENDLLIFDIESESDKLISFMSEFVELKNPVFRHFHKTSDKKK